MLTDILLDAEDLKFIVPGLLKKYHSENKILNIAYSNAIAVSEIVKIMETKLNIKANVNFLEIGNFFTFDNSEFLMFLKNENICYDTNYVEKVINKYIVS